jgi:hypothetical protein
MGNKPLEFGSEDENILLRKSFCSILLTGTAVVIVVVV